MFPAMTNLKSLADCHIQLGLAVLVGLLDRTVSNSVRRRATVRRRLKSALSVKSGTEQEMKVFAL